MEQMDFDKRRGKVCENQASLVNDRSGSVPNKIIPSEHSKLLFLGNVPFSGHCLQAVSIFGEFLG